jgi:hypothetical protein
MKKITKKEIAATLRTLDRTQIFRLFKAVNGGNEIDRSALSDFIVANAPTKKVRKAAYDIAYYPSNPHHHYSEDYKGKHGFFEPLPRQKAVEYTMKQLQDPASSYSKFPIMGHTHLYFASIAYGHRDYNKWRSVKIEGNEKFCDMLIAYVNKFVKVTE